MIFLFTSFVVLILCIGTAVKRQNISDGNQAAGTDDGSGYVIEDSMDSAATEEGQTIPLLNEVAICNAEDEDQKIELFMLDEATNTYAAFVPGGMEAHAVMTLSGTDLSSVSLNGTHYYDNDPLPYFQKSDEKEYSEGDIYDPIFTDEDLKIRKNQKTLAYTGRDLSYKTTDGVLIDVIAYGQNGKQEKGYIRFF